MFILKLQDRKGNELNEGDFVKISDGKRFTFFAEVKYLKDEGAIAPFHTFTFHSFEKIDKVPDGAIQSTETRYKIFYTYPDFEGDSGADTEAEAFKNYLMSWRECESHISKRAYKIEKVAGQTSLPL